MINKFNVLNGAKYFSSGIFQNYLVLQQAKNHHLLPDMNFNGHCLIKNNISIPKKRNIQKAISEILGPQLRSLKTDFSLGNCLFGFVKLTNNDDLHKYKNTGYGIGFDYRSEFLFTDGSYGKNVIIFGPDMGSFEHVDKKRKIY